MQKNFSRLGRGGLMNNNFNSSSLYNYNMPWWKETIYGTELLGMRLLRKKSLKEMSKVTGEKISDLKNIENDSDMIVPPPLAGKYMMYLSCNMNHVYQFREIVDGKRKTFKESRSISAKLKRDVYEKCNNKCTKCGSTKKLHIHHIKEFSKGGLNEIENLILLCVSCHAEAHRNNQAYHLLKKAADTDE